PATEGNRRIVFRFLVSPMELSGDGHVERLTCVRNVYAPGTERVAVTPSEEHFDIETGVVLRAIGYRGVPVIDLPFDDVNGVVPNTDGRVQVAADGEVVPGLFVTGWIKRGATGGIGMNRICGQETAEAVLKDYVAGSFSSPATSRDDVADIVSDRGARRIDMDGWKAIDAAEKNAGKSAGRRRVKFVSLNEFEVAAGMEPVQ
ncbi:ferredoxin, partial [Streptomyces sp. SID10244]|nr:ferredoxin [Streptomyces sp. SID10244]